MEYRKLGRFNIERSVARGGMGEIVKSVDDSGRLIALKTILQEHQFNETFRDLFFREAEISVQLDHPHIVKAYRFDQVGKQLVLALEYLDGVNLKDILREVYARRLIVPASIAIAIMRRVLLGLDYAHKKRDRKNKLLGIVHRDLNPANIFLTYAGDVKILDFGISKAVNRDIHQLTPHGELRGKMCYISPEQIHGKHVDYRSDIFAAGIVFWELLAGQPLFLRDTDTQVMEAIVRGEYRSLREIRNDLPSELEEILMTALAVNPKSRFKDCAEFVRDLDERLKPHLMPGISEEEISIFVRALLNIKTSETDPQFLSGYAWLMTQMAGREAMGLELVKRLAQENPQRPYVQLNYARAQLTVGDRLEGLRIMRRLARADSLESEAQEMLEWLGVRRRPVLRFLSRGNPANFVLGKIRHKILGPTPYQNEFIAA